MAREGITEVREILRNWGTYGPVDDEGRMYAWRPLKVDEMTDEEIEKVARKIATEKLHEGN